LVALFLDYPAAYIVESYVSVAKIALTRNMSLGLQSHGSKRLLEEEDRVPFAEFNPQKRLRHIASPSGRCGTPHFDGRLAYTIGSATLAALHALFPHMDDKVSCFILCLILGSASEIL
jgi:hypothetical protein